VLRYPRYGTCYTRVHTVLPHNKHEPLLANRTASPPTGSHFPSRPLKVKIGEMSYVVIQDRSTMPEGTAATMAHEMGHNFGFEHDDELPGPCACDDPVGQCIMASTDKSVISDNCL